MKNIVVRALVLMLGLAAAGAAVPLGALGQVPSQTLPPYAQPSTDQTLNGRITAINGRFSISIRDDNGTIDNIALHRGTIINPTGLTLAVGMRVKILGYNAGAVFEANEIDTPYTYEAPPPPPVYYGPGWWYPGYVYGYGPAFSLNLRIDGGHPGFQHAPFPHQHPVVQPPYPQPRVGRTAPSVPAPHR